MLKERLADPKTYHEAIDRLSRHLILLPKSRVYVVNPLSHVFTDGQAIELRFRRFQRGGGDGGKAHLRRPYLPKWLIDAPSSLDPTPASANENRVVVAPSAVNAINRICRLMRKGIYAFSRLRAVAILKNASDRYAGAKRKSRLRLTAYRGLTCAQRDEYRLMVKPAFPDALVLRALAESLTQLFPPGYFVPECCGYVPRRGAKEAVKQVMTRLTGGSRVVLRLDIRSFNETVPQGALLDRVLLRAQEAGWSRADVDFLKGLMTRFFLRVDHVLGTPGVGIGMGTSLTPLFTNIYLDGLDRHLKDLSISFSRFGDDLALFFDNPEAARQAQREAAGFVADRLRQEINDTKAAITVVRAAEVLGFGSDSLPSGRGNVSVFPGPGSSRGFDFCAYHFEMDEKGLPTVRIKDATLGKIRGRIKLLTQVPRTIPLQDEADAYAERVIEKIDSLLGFFPTPRAAGGKAKTAFFISGWPAAFMSDVSSDQIKGQFRMLDTYILHRLKKLLKALRGRVDDPRAFREEMRLRGLRTFMDAWNRHPRPYRY